MATKILIIDSDEPVTSETISKALLDSENKEKPKVKANRCSSTINFVVGEERKKELQNLAKLNNRSLSEMARIAIHKFISDFTNNEWKYSNCSPTDII